MRAASTALLAAALLLHAAAARAVDADPSSYLQVLPTLQPGDTLNLAAGTYTGGLPITNLNGAADAWITIAGPASGQPAVFEGDDCCNTVELVNSSYVAVERLTVDGNDLPGVFGVSAKGGLGNVVHHIRIEGCTFVGQGATQQTVGISTKTPTYGWIIRNNIIDGAGTGLYLGNSTHDDPFVGGLIEHNLVKRTTGYGMQIKSQNAWPAHAALPDEDAPRTIIRHNVFLKDDTVGEDGARPNLLVGGPPPSGPGAGALVEIYGNVFVHNPNESLLQATGRVTIHDNLFVDVADSALRLTDHEGFSLLAARVYDNTFYAAARAVLFASDADEGDRVEGNLIFAGAAVEGPASGVGDNLVDEVAAAGMYVKSPSVTLGSMDFFPLIETVQREALDTAPYAGDTDHDCDFNGSRRELFSFRGAYTGEGTNPGWKPAEEIKPPVACGGGGSGGGGAGGGGAGSGGGPAGSGGGASSGAGASGAGSGDEAGDEGGCGCRAAGAAPAAGAWGAMLALAALLGRRRRR